MGKSFSERFSTSIVLETNLELGLPEFDFQFELNTKLFRNRILSEVDQIKHIFRRRIFIVDDVICMPITDLGTSDPGFPSILPVRSGRPHACRADF